MYKSFSSDMLKIRCPSTKVQCLYACRPVKQWYTCITIKKQILCHSCEVNLYDVKFLSDGTRTSHVKTTSHNATFGKTRHVQCTSTSLNMPLYIQMPIQFTCTFTYYFIKV